MAAYVGCDDIDESLVKFFLPLLIQLPCLIPIFQDGKPRLHVLLYNL
jgi:hypothetical protein